MINIRKLDARLVELGLTRKDVIKATGLSKRTVCARWKDIYGKNWTAHNILQVAILCKIVDLNPYFFVPEVADMEQSITEQKFPN